ncbi:MAG: ABC transporter permease [Alicyclobacillus sp.]|nr:ABC transporter permease [Alicyclobacillus sp.]
MVVYIVKRLFGMIPMLLAVTVVAFLLMHAAPGDAWDALINPSIKDVDQLRQVQAAAAGWNDPLWHQYVRWLGLFVQGQWGYSFAHHVPVWQLVGPAWLNSALLACCTEALTLVIGVPLGLWQAYRAHSWWDHVWGGVSVVVYALPFYVVALVLLDALAFHSHWLPAQGAVGTGPGAGSLGDRLRHALLPAISLALVNSAVYSRYVRDAVLAASARDYVRTARAKGLRERTVYVRHVLRTGLSPLITQLGLDLGALAGGLVVAEGLFSYPGLGLLLLDAVHSRDSNVILAVTVVTSSAVLIGNLLADVLYAWADPRVRTAGRESQWPVNAR